MENSPGRLTEIYRKQEGVISRKIAGEVLLVPVMGDLADMQKIFSLGPVAESIWEKIDGEKTVRQITEEIVETFAIGKDEAEADLLEFHDELTGNGLSS